MCSDVEPRGLRLGCLQAQRHRRQERSKGSLSSVRKSLHTWISGCNGGAGALPPIGNWHQERRSVGKVLVATRVLVEGKTSQGPDLACGIETTSCSPKGE